MKRLARAVRVLRVLIPMWSAYAWATLRGRLGWPLPQTRWDSLHRRWASRFTIMASSMRGGFIKIGQVLSTRVDLLPRVWIAELAKLQDRVTPEPAHVIEAQLRAAYGREPVPELFASIAPEASAAASFGQVHRAVTREGVTVALKVQYPGLAEQLSTDLVIAARLVPLFNLFVPDVRLQPVFAEMRRALMVELDYIEEADSSERIRANFAKSPVEGIVVPRVLRALSGPTVLCTEWFDGAKVTDPAFLADPRLDRDVLVDRIIEAWVQMMYIDGVFQSDPHPGNLHARVGDAGLELAILDYGQVKVLTRRLHQGLVQSVMAFMTRNREAFGESLVSLGLLRSEDLPRIAPLVEKVLAKYEAVSAGSETMDFGWLRTEVFSSLEALRGLVLPQDLVLYGRTLVLLGGLVRGLNPTAEVLELVRPHFLRAMLSGGPAEDDCA